MKKRTSNGKLSTKIFMIVSFIIVLSIVSVCGFNLLSLDSTVTDLSYSNATNTTSYLKSKVESLLMPKVALVETLVSTEAVKYYDYENLMTAFYDILMISPDISNLYLASSLDSYFFALSRDGDNISIWGADEDFDPRERDWFIRAVKEEQTIFTEPYVDVISGSFVVSIATPVRDSLGGIVGALGVDVTLDELNTFMSTITIGEDGYAFLLDGTGTMIYHPDQSQILLNASDYQGDAGVIAGEMISGASGVGETDFNEERHIVFYEPIELTGWSVASVIPKAELNEPIYGSIRT
ncbi:MAG: cache domain-containing protein, partial [Firmicutes bacterium]|nr:cache domain-containing protein [Bacillota bacterium]